SHEPQRTYPVFNRVRGIGILGCEARVRRQPSGDQDLTIEISVAANKRLHGVGVGIALTAMNGAVACFLGPIVTRFVVSEVFGKQMHVVKCAAVDRYLAGGDYLLTIWLAWPRVEELLRVEEAGLIKIDPKDVFGSGIGIEGRYHGVCPIPFTFHPECSANRKP